MRFTVSMKDPDTLIDAVREAVTAEVGALPLSDDGEREAVIESRVEKTLKVCQKWFRHSEYLTVEIDTEAKTCTVVKEKN